MKSDITKGHEWHLVVFAASYDPETSTLYDEMSRLYDKAIYDQLSVGMTITVK
jgi:hypothetical protein